MKAAVHTAYGSPDVIRIEDVSKPVPDDGKVLIAVHATTVNRTDIGFLKADPFFIRVFSGLTKPKVTILGTEFAGRVEAVGSSVTAYAVGDRVFGFSPDSRFGAHAEYLTMREGDMMAHTPAHVSCLEMAPATEGAHYALHGIRAAKVREGSRVLVYGATGAIGTAAVQLCKHFGAHVVAVCDTARVDMVRSLGADVVIDYTKTDFVKEALATSGQPYDFAMDAVGKSTFGRCKPLLRPGGVYISTDLGPMAQNPFLVPWTKLFDSKKVLFPIPNETRKDAEFLKTLIEEGSFRPVIDRVYPLDEIADAFRYVDTHQKTGNVVIAVESNPLMS
jgi:NADPH:quinone reductase-like Zn-dependent oxidoreductase